MSNKYIEKIASEEDRNWDKAGPYSRANMMVGGAIPMGVGLASSSALLSAYHNLKAPLSSPRLRVGKVAAAAGLGGAVIGALMGNHDFQNYRGASNEEMAILESAYKGLLEDSLPVDSRATRIAHKDLREALARDRARRHMQAILEGYGEE